MYVCMYIFMTNSSIIVYTLRECGHFIHETEFIGISPTIINYDMYNKHEFYIIETNTCINDEITMNKKKYKVDILYKNLDEFDTFYNDKIKDTYDELDIKKLFIELPIVGDDAKISYNKLPITIYNNVKNRVYSDITKIPKRENKYIMTVFFDLDEIITTELEQEIKYTVSISNDKELFL